MYLFNKMMITQFCLANVRIKAEQKSESKFSRFGKEFWCDGILLPSLIRENFEIKYF
jgi:hypothetical protein